MRRAALLGLALLLPCSCLGAALRVAVFPPRIQSARDLRWLREGLWDMICSRLADEQLAPLGRLQLAPELARGGTPPEVARRAGAAWIALPLLTELAGAFSLDVRMVDLSSGRTERAFVDGRWGELIPRLRDLAQYMRWKLLGRRPIAEVAVEGNRLVTEGAILAKLRSRPGGEFDPEVAREDLRRVYAMGYFESVEVLSRETPRGIRLVIRVRERPKVRSIRIEGLKRLKEAEVRKDLPLKVGDLANPQVIKECERVLLRKAEAKGLYGTTVSHRVSQVEEGVAVAFRVTEGRPLRVKRIRFVGNRALSDSRLRSVMQTTDRGLLRRIFSLRTLLHPTSVLGVSNVLRHDVLEQDVERITHLYYNEGYARARVDEPRIEHDEHGIYITIPIYEGKRYRIGKVEVEGELIAPREEILRSLKVRSGQVFRQDDIRRDVVALSRRYAEEGYAFADVTPLTTINRERATVDLTYHVDRGPQAHIGRIEIWGNTRTRDEVIRRELLVKEGDLYRPSRIRKSRDAVNRLGFFKDVKVIPRPHPDRRTVDLEVRVKERPTGMFSVGAGYSSGGGASVIGQVSESNLLGRGLSLSLYAQLGGYTTRYSLTFTHPWLFGRRLSGTFTAFDLYREYEDFDLDTRGAGVSFAFPVAETAWAHLGYRLESSKLEEVGWFSALLLQRQAAWGRRVTSSVLGGLSFDDRDDPLFPTRGTVANATLQLAGLGGDNKFVRAIGSLSHYLPLPLGLTLMARAMGGYVRAYAGEEVPAYERFFMGGINSLRGFKERSVGPRDSWSGDVIGGTKEILGSLELLSPVWKDMGMRALIFMDAGGVYDEGEPIGANLRLSVGWGIRWFSPMGPLRLEFGYVLRSQPSDEESRMEFSFGGRW